MSFVYFLPGRRGVDQSDLSRLGLDKILDRPHGSAAVANTPSGGPGFTVVDRSTPITLARIFPDLQIWKAAPKVDGVVPYYVGYHKENKPTPTDLERPRVIDGDLVVDLDGEIWTAPQLREWRVGEDPLSPFSCSPTVPRVCDLNEDGDVILGDVVPEYREIWEKSWSVASALWPDHVDTGSKMSDSDAIKFAGDLLGVNYRVSFLELALLKSISPEIARDICRAGIDAKGFEDTAKNLVSRSDSETIVSDCGPDRPTSGSPTQTPTDLQSAS